jgi:DNA transformation protein
MKQERAGETLESMPNLGTAAVGLLRSVGIDTPQALRELGSLEAAKRIRLAGADDSVCRSRLCALEGAIRGVRWHAIPKGEPNVEAVCGLCYVVSAEDRLAGLMQQRSVELLIEQPDPNRSIIVAGNDSTLLQETLGPEVVSTLSNKIAQWERDLMNMKERRPPIVGSELRRLINELEAEAAQAQHMSNPRADPSLRGPEPAGDTRSVGHGKEQG